ncbi:MAG: hypothetical protein OHK0046_48020 [Anaerolineae bacterium]
MSRYTGKDLWIQFDGQVVSANYRALGVERGVDTEDATAGNEEDKSYIPTLRDVSGSMTLVVNDDTGGTATARKFYEGKKGTLLWGDQGTAAGKPKYGCEVIITSVSDPVEYAALRVREISWQRTGPWLFDYITLGSVFP